MSKACDCGCCPICGLAERDRRIADLEQARDNALESARVWREAHEDLRVKLAERTKERDELRHAACEAGLVEVVVCLGCGKPQPCRSDCPAGSGKSFTNPAREGRDALAAALSYEKARVTSLELAVENTLAKVHELTCAWEAVQANCVAGSIDPRPGVARSSIIRIGEICEEQDYRPRLAARLAAERKELIRRIAISIDNYPDAGGDIEILKALDGLIARSSAIERKAGAAEGTNTLRRIHEGASRQLAEPRGYDDQHALMHIATVAEEALARIERGESKPPAEPEVKP